MAQHFTLTTLFTGLYFPIRISDSYSPYNSDKNKQRLENVTHPDFSFFLPSIQEKFNPTFNDKP